jgi:LysM repeat protein
MSGRLELGVAIVIATLATNGAAYAQNREAIRIRVNEGDTLELLAAEYYGDRQHAVFIMNANDIPHGQALRLGTRLKIPMQRELTASVGDTLAGLAEQHLGDARRAEFLAAFNQLPADTSVAAGQKIVIPFHVTHTAESKESFASIAAAYFGDAKQASLLKRYNFTEKDSLEKGESITIPIYNVRVRAAKLPPPDKKSAEREARLRDMEERAIRALPDARAAWRDGEYARVKKLLVELDLDYLPASLASEAGVLLAAAYIAFNDADSALALMAKIRQRSPELALSAYDHSPKVRDVWMKAGGRIGTE